MADTRGPGLIGHGIADADNRVAPPGRPALECDVNSVAERTLERPERHPVDRVHDHRHMLVPGRCPTQDSRLGTVGVDDVGLEPSERLPQLPVGFQVGPGTDGTNQFWHHLDRKPSLSGPIEQIAFGTFRRTGDQGDVVVVLVMQIVDREQGVLLGASNDQACDDMNDLHDRGPRCHARRRLRPTLIHSLP